MSLFDPLAPNETTGEIPQPVAYLVRVTLQQIADALQLSRSTVCRGLREDPSIPPGTRERIRLASQRLGYRSDPLLSELATARWSREQVAGGSTIAYIDCVAREVIDWGHLRMALQKQAELLGYRVEVLNRAAFGSSSRLQRTLRNRGLTDIVIGPIYHEHLTVQLDWSKFICIQLLPGFFHLPLHSVRRDHFEGVMLAWRKAVSYGYRRIGMALFRHPFPVIDDIMRTSGAQACQQQLFPGLPALPLFLYSSEDFRVPAFIKWIERHRPDVVIGFNGSDYIHIREAFGHDIAYASLHATGEMSGIPETLEKCAEKAVNLLQQCRRTHEWGIPEQRIDCVLEPTWFEGTTMPNKNGAMPPLS